MERKIKYMGKIFEVDIERGGRCFISRTYYENQLGFCPWNGVWLSRGQYEVV